MDYLSSAWESAQEHIATAQSNQKRYYDRRADEKRVRKGDRVMVLCLPKLKVETGN